MTEKSKSKSKPPQSRGEVGEPPQSSRSRSEQPCHCVTLFFVYSVHEDACSSMREPAEAAEESTYRDDDSVDFRAGASDESGGEEYTQIVKKPRREYQFIEGELFPRNLIFSVKSHFFCEISSLTLFCFFWAADTKTLVAKRRRVAKKKKASPVMKPYQTCQDLMLTDPCFCFSGEPHGFRGTVANAASTKLARGPK